MSTTQIIIIAVLAIAILAVIAYNFMPKKGSGSGTNTNTAAANTAGTTVTNTTNSLNMSKLLYKGMSGPEVSELQRLLNQYGASILVDGDFGSRTEDALFEATCKKSIKLSEVTAAVFNKNANGCVNNNNDFWGTQQSNTTVTAQERWCSWLPGSTCYSTEAECKAKNAPYFLGYTCTKY